jgi:adenylyltransferase/sulfurtransferase
MVALTVVHRVPAKLSVSLSTPLNQFDLNTNPVLDRSNGHARYLRQATYPPIGPEGQRHLAAASVLLVGCGALGSAVANLLVRAGIGRLVIADRDYVELHNLQRQSLFDEDDVARHLPKAEAAVAKLRRINTDVSVESAVVDVNASNVEGLLENVQVIVDGTDNFETRYLINDVAVKFDRPWVYGGVIATYGITMTIRPGLSPCLRCVFAEPPEPGGTLTCDTAGVLGPAVSLVASVQAAETMKLAIGDHDALNRDLLAVDVWRLTFDRIPLDAPAPDCPTCGRRDFSFLDRPPLTQTTVLCGHDAVQVRVDPGVKLDLDALASRLRSAGEVLANPYLVRFRDPTAGHELTIFADGRAIIKGTGDETDARAIYARYIGL